MSDWFTIVAQVINFLILVALLKHFLYTPVIRAMDEREESIRKRKQEAEEREHRAEEEARQFKDKQEELDRSRDQVMKEARESAEKKRDELIQEARSEADAKRQDWDKSLQQEKDAFLSELKSKVGSQAFAVAGRAMRDLCGADVQVEAVRRFVEVIEHLDDETRESLKEAFHDNDRQLQITSSFELPDEEKDRLHRALSEQLDADVKPEYRISEEIIAGVVLQTDGHKLDWSIRDYLRSLEEEVAGILQGEGDSDETENSEQGDDADTDTG